MTDEEIQEVVNAIKKDTELQNKKARYPIYKSEAEYLIYMLESIVEQNKSFSDPTSRKNGWY